MIVLASGCILLGVVALAAANDAPAPGWTLLRGSGRKRSIPPVP
jgi:hypothetical protein